MPGLAEVQEGVRRMITHFEKVLVISVQILASLEFDCFGTAAEISG